MYLNIDCSNGYLLIFDSLFPTIDIPGLGTFQDGGIRRLNNPINLALSEAKHLWPNSPNPDVFISLGTGSAATDSSQTVSRFRNIFVDGWVPRIYRSFSSSFEGQCGWREILGLLDDKSRDDYFRFDLSVPSGLPSMDNTDCMDQLSKLVHSNPSGQQKHLEAIASLLATSFFFQLDSRPQYYSGFLQCIGTIRCRAPAQYAINWIDGFDSSRKDFYKDNMNLGLHLTPDDICYSCNRYCRRVRFIVRDLNENIGISIQFGGKQRHLSGFPNNMQWFIEQQGIDGNFGSPNHRVYPRPGCLACEGPEAGKSKKRKYIDI